MNKAYGTPVEQKDYGFSKESLISAICVSLKSRRTALGLTQKELSDKTGISIPNISNFENEYRIPSFGDLVSLRKALNTKMAFLLPSLVGFSSENDAPRISIAGGFTDKYRKIQDSKIRGSVILLMSHFSGTDKACIRDVSVCSDSYGSGKDGISSYSAALGGRLKFCRELCGYSVGETAEALGISAASYYAYETGRRIPDIYIMYSIAALFRQEAYDIIDIDIRDENRGNLFYETAYFRHLFGSFDKMYQDTLMNYLDAAMKSDRNLKYISLPEK